MNEYKNIETKKSFAEEFKDYKKELIAKRIFNTSLADIDRAIKWYEEIAQGIFKDNKKLLKSVLVFEELFMNAYEHGNLGIDKQLKAELLKKSKYLATLKEIEKECNKKIDVNIYKLTGPSNYLAVEICDEGEGFDSEKIKNIDANGVNGRGILMSSKNAEIYYNQKRNCLLFVMEIGRGENVKWKINKISSL